VDLYVGIGYFAFSYAKAGVRKVLGWDLNGWSCEGLQRAAKANKWKSAFVTGDEQVLMEAVEDDEVRLMVFNESNEHAAQRIRKVKAHLPPVRHVNCGLLPTSKGSWDIAVQVLDPIMGGWIHVHENFAVAEIDEKAEEVRQEMELLLAKHRPADKRKPEVEHINRLKSYAPGVMHCVLDIRVPPSLSPS